MHFLTFATSCTNSRLPIRAGRAVAWPTEGSARSENEVTHWLKKQGFGVGFAQAQSAKRYEIVENERLIVGIQNAWTCMPL